MTPRTLRALVALAALAGLGVLLFVVGPPPRHRVGTAETAPADTLWRVPDFTLVSQRGEPFGTAELAGEVWVADFFFTTCRGICPALTRTFQEVRRRVPDLRLVSVSVDPEHDTPSVLAAYADSVGADAAWTFLTGPPQEVRRIVREGFKLAAEPAPPGSAEPILHSSTLVLVDGAGLLRGVYDAFDPASLDKLVARVHTLRAGTS
jgi:protein SCO1/2